MSTLAPLLRTHNLFPFVKIIPQNSCLVGCFAMFAERHHDRRLVDVTIILLIGIALMALVIYFGPKNPYCFRDIRSAADKVLRDSVTVAECLKGGPLEDSSPASKQLDQPVTTR
jgi:hypothetical protein